MHWQTNKYIERAFPDIIYSFGGCVYSKNIFVLSRSLCTNCIKTKLNRHWLDFLTTGDQKKHPYRTFWYPRILPKKGTNEFVHSSTVRQKNPNSFVRFLEESSAWKNHFDIVWPLLHNLISTRLWHFKDGGS